MKTKLNNGQWFIGVCALIVSFLPMSVSADEIWVAPTLQSDFGGLGVSSNVFWPVTPLGAVRFALGVPDDLQTFQQATILIIPAVPGAGTMTLYVCAAEDSELATANCAGPVEIPYVGAINANELHEIDITAALAAQVGVAGSTNLAVLAFTTPNVVTDKVVGMRFRYESGNTLNKTNIYQRVVDTTPCTYPNCTATAQCDNTTDIAMGGSCSRDCAYGVAASGQECRRENPWERFGTINNHNAGGQSGYTCVTRNQGASSISLLRPVKLTASVSCITP